MLVLIDSWLLKCQLVNRFISVVGWYSCWIVDRFMFQFLFSVLIGLVLWIMWVLKVRCLLNRCEFRVRLIMQCGGFWVLVYDFLKLLFMQLGVWVSLLFLCCVLQVWCLVVMFGVQVLVLKQQCVDRLVKILLLLQLDWNFMLEILNWLMLWIRLVDSVWQLWVIRLLMWVLKYVSFSVRWLLVVNRLQWRVLVLIFQLCVCFGFSLFIGLVVVNRFSVVLNRFGSLVFLVYFMQIRVFLLKWQVMLVVGENVELWWWIGCDQVQLIGIFRFCGLLVLQKFYLLMLFIVFFLYGEVSSDFWVKLLLVFGYQFSSVMCFVCYDGSVGLLLSSLVQWYWFCILYVLGVVRWLWLCIFIWFQWLLVSSFQCLLGCYFSEVMVLYFLCLVLCRKWLLIRLLCLIGFELFGVMFLLLQDRLQLSVNVLVCVLNVEVLLVFRLKCFCCSGFWQVFLQLGLLLKLGVLYYLVW